MQRALVRLTQEIYAEDVHVMLELVQNADDNLYAAAVQPALAFVFCSGACGFSSHAHTPR
jgi:hypothetical protein